MFSQPSALVDLNAYNLQEVLRILDLHVPGIEVWAFGSRAKWTAKAYSDLDLALITKHPLSLEDEAKLREALDESTLPIRVDFVDWSTISESFRKIVSRDKVVIRRVEAVNADQVSWPVIPLEAALDALIDYRGKTPEKTTSGIPLITAKVIKAGRIEPPTEFISSENYDKWMTRGFPKVGDVVLTTEAPLGEVAQLDSARVALAQRVILLRGKAGTLDNTYLRYLLQTSDMQEQLASRATGTTVLGIKQSELRQISIRIPPLEMQRGAAGLLAHLDDRIALLRETNATLEAIAQALFKSWFVDFDPVYAKQQGLAPAGMDDATAALFPDGFESSIIGDIPAGWNVKTLEDLLVLQRGFDLPAQDRIPGAYPIIAASGPSGTHREAMVKGPGVVTGRSGVLGRVFLEFGDYWPLNTALWIKEFRAATPCYAYELLRLLDFKAFNAGSAVPTLNRNHIHGLPYVIPARACVEAFENIAEKLHRRVKENEAQVQTLATLRDTLLPRLISGQLRLPEAEEALAEAIA